MVNRISFFVVLLISVLTVVPAFSDEPATQNWVKTWVPSWAENRGTNYFYTNSQGDKLSGFTAHQMRDLLYRHKADTAYAPDHSMVKAGYELRTQGQTAFEGINEVLEKVDGNNGVAGSAVQLETKAQNAYGAINELNGKVGDLQTSVNGKVSNWDLISNYYTKEQINGIMIDGKLIYTAAENGGVTVDNETRQIKLDVDSSNPNVTYVYRNGRWVALDYVSTWDGPTSN